MSEALMKLLRSLSIIGIDSERVAVRKSDGLPNEVKVEIDTAPGSRIIVTVGEFWRYPTIPCYFVNFGNVNGDFMACSGTPHIEQAMFDLGQCFRMVQPIKGD